MPTIQHIYRYGLRCNMCGLYKPQNDVGGDFESCECKHACQVVEWRDGKPVMVVWRNNFACVNFIPKQYEIEFT